MYAWVIGANKIKRGIRTAQTTKIKLVTMFTTNQHNFKQRCCPPHSYSFNCSKVLFSLLGSMYFWCAVIFSCISQITKRITDSMMSRRKIIFWNWFALFYFVKFKNDHKNTNKMLQAVIYIIMLFAGRVISFTAIWTGVGSLVWLWPEQLQRRLLARESVFRKTLLMSWVQPKAIGWGLS